MAFFIFIWDGENERHIARHDFTPEEFEEVVCFPEYRDFSRSTGLPLAGGTTSTGRQMVCIYELIDDVTVYPVTAFDPTKRSR